MPFFSNGRYGNPMVVRIAAYAYQKGFGGHFHNDNAVAALRNIPGLVIASPARPDDASAMLRACVRSGRVCVFLEPIALYHARDLHNEGDGGWLARLPAAAAPARVTSEDSFIPLGDAAHHVLLSEQDIEAAALKLLR